MPRQRASLRQSYTGTVEPIGIEVRTLPKPVTGRVLFGNDRPLEMEIGTGRGTFIGEEAQSRPDVNFIGIERARRYWRFASDRLRRRGCGNVRVILIDAGYFLREFVPAATLAAIYVHFPDPWPKKRHHKRRLVQPQFIREVERTLARGGRLQVVTDHPEYFAQIAAVIGSSSLIPSPYRRPATAAHDELVGSNFERKYVRLGRNPSAVAAVKK